MSVRSLLKKIKIQDFGFTHHPADQLSKDQKISYLEGVALIAIEDNQLTKKEIEYLHLLARSLHLSKNDFQHILKYSQHPDEKMLHHIIEVFKFNDLKYNFILDCLIIAHVNKHSDAIEEELIEQYEELFLISSQQSEELFKIFTFLKKRHSHKLLNLLKQSKLFKKSNFKYLFEYFNIDETQNIKIDKNEIFIFHFIQPHIRHGSLKNALKIASQPITNLQFSIFLNELYFHNKIKIDKENNIILKKKNFILLTKQNKILQFHNSLFKIKENMQNHAVYAITFHGAFMFIKWLNHIMHTEYKLTEFQSDKYNNLSMDDIHHYLLDGELFIKNNEYAKVEHEELLHFSHEEHINANYASKNSTFRLMI